ncbi:hypothetical protein M0R88_03310 [Halorussus gelatinilyticus]|uniref:DUF7979 domain-containing protein n=1 Tax=Halorussus gelatinilyticus TaxID=2937524 RepID=A0A8U0IK54_9EURY|nr:hypothetical protein [Halorussus gelatinilyticus]UPW01138.1 hypothetical protein M0R88_03310 [Halorussus gelatinilyticus]
MRPNAALIGTLALAVLLAGCAGVVPTGEPTATDTPTTADAETATETATTTTEAWTTTDADPEKGDQLLSVVRIDEETAMKYDANSRAEFSNLSDRRQKLFERALRCDCNVNQNAFSFHDEDRIEVVTYRGEFYYVRVAIV